MEDLRSRGTSVYSALTSNYLKLAYLYNTIITQTILIIHKIYTDYNYFNFYGKNTIIVNFTVYGYACMLPSLHYFDKKFRVQVQEVNSNTRVGYERC